MTDPAKREGTGERNRIDDHALVHFLTSDKKKKDESLVSGEQKKLWERWHRMVVLETRRDFFDGHELSMLSELKERIGKDFYYLNLTGRQSLLLFEESEDFVQIPKRILTFMKQNERARIYIAVSNAFTGYGNMPRVFMDLNILLEDKFYYPNQRIFYQAEEDLLRKETESQDSQVLQKISEDIMKKDAEKLWKHFRILDEKFRDSRRCSAMYMKYVFSGVIEALYQDVEFRKERDIISEISRVYCCDNKSEICKIAQESIVAYEEYLSRSLIRTKQKIDQVEKYIRENCDRNLDAVKLSELVDLPAGYFSMVFRKELGRNLEGFLHRTRLKKAVVLLSTTDLKDSEIAARVGIQVESYFRDCFARHMGCQPEEFRRINNSENG